MAEEAVAVPESQHNNSLVFASEYGDTAEDKSISGDEDTKADLIQSDGNGVVIPGTNDTATQADRSSDMLGDIHTSPLFGNLRSFSPSKNSQDSARSSIKHIHFTREMQSMPNLELPTYRSNGTPSILQRSASDSHSKDTQVILPKLNEVDLGADTQVIGHQQEEHEHLSLGADTQVIGKHSDQAIYSGSPTQGDVQLPPPQNDETQKIVAFQPEDDATQVIGRRNSVWESTQPITQVVSGLSSTHTVTSSPNRANDSEYNEENTTTVMLSPVNREQEPTTQVLNTQEEDDVFLPLTKERHSVDLSCKPVLLSSQKDDPSHDLPGRDRHELSIISNDDKDEKFNDIFYEDSLFKHKLKKTQTDVDILDDEIDEEPSQPHLRVKRKTSWSQSSSQTPSGSHLTVKKATWSQSSSDLEDISQDVSGLDLDILKRSLSEDVPMLPDGYDESRERINVPKKRRMNHVPGSQSQTMDLNVISEEPLTTLSMDQLDNDRSVWAFFQFRYYPARVLRSIDLNHTLVEFYDWCQIEMKNTDLFVLDVRIGDNLRTFKAPSEFVVTRMSTNDDTPFKCVRGYDTLHLSKKGKHNIGVGGELQVSLATCYMEPNDWALHQLRFQLIYDGVDLLQRDYGFIQPLLNQLESSQATDQGLPVPEPKYKSPRKAKPETATFTKVSQVFSGQVFFITSMAPERKEALTKTIERHGGLVYDLEISKLVSFEASSSSHLRLVLQKFSGINFGAFLSDGHSRSAKYLQALALGWPILADNFVEYAIESDSVLDNWHAFLLPAGQSFYTKNLKSQDVFRFRANLESGADLNGQLNNNANLMSSLNVLILLRKQDNQTIKMCEFIFHAFGAQTLRSFNSEGRLLSHIKENSEKEFFVFDNHGRDIERTRKLKAKNAVRYGIIDWEWVVQCTISSFIWPPRTYSFVSN